MQLVVYFDVLDNQWCAAEVAWLSAAGARPVAGSAEGCSPFIMVRQLQVRPRHFGVMNEAYERGVLSDQLSEGWFPVYGNLPGYYLPPQSCDNSLAR